MKKLWGKNQVNDSAKELSISISDQGVLKNVSTWRFFPKLGYCFRQQQNKWEEMDYNFGLSICKRVMNASKTDNSIHVKGSMIDELNKNDMVSNLFNGEKIILQ